MPQSPNERPPTSEPTIPVEFSSAQPGDKDLPSDPYLEGGHSETASSDDAEATTADVLEAGRQIREAIDSLLDEKKQLWVLDIGMAPGGYAAYLLEAYPGVRIHGITLSPIDGGLDLPIEVVDWKSDPNIIVYFHDITSYALGPVPGNRRKQFKRDGPRDDEKYDLIICDAQLLDFTTTGNEGSGSSQQPSVRQTRLLTSQLILALTHINDEGMLYLCLEGVNSRSLVQIWYRLSLFAYTWFFKPNVPQENRSLYLVATKVKKPDEHKKWFLAILRSTWYAATFRVEPAVVTDRELTHIPAADRRRMLAIAVEYRNAAILTQEAFEALRALLS